MKAHPLLRALHDPVDVRIGQRPLDPGRPTSSRTRSRSPDLGTPHACSRSTAASAPPPPGRSPRRRPCCAPADAHPHAPESRSAAPRSRRHRVAAPAPARRASPLTPTTRTRTGRANAPGSRSPPPPAQATASSAASAAPASPRRGRAGGCGRSRAGTACSRRGHCASSRSDPWRACSHAEPETRRSRPRRSASDSPSAATSAPPRPPARPHSQPAAAPTPRTRPAPSRQRGHRLPIARVATERTGPDLLTVVGTSTSSPRSAPGKYCATCSPPR